MKNTKRALLMSVMSMLLCIAMLAGSTFAWFTDEVTSGKNTIVAGNLDIELYHAKDFVKGEDGNVTPIYDKVNEETNIFDEDALWEPGRVEVVYLKAVNVGTLALKYALGINVADKNIGMRVEKVAKLDDNNEVVTDNNGKVVYEDKEIFIDLSKYIKFAIIGGVNQFESGDAGRQAALEAAEGAEQKGWIADLALASAGVLYPEGTEKEVEVDGVKSTVTLPDFEEVTLIVYMPSDVNNMANYRFNDDDKADFDTLTAKTDKSDEDESRLLDLEKKYIPTIDLGVNLVATQTPYELDSFGDDYDATAPLETITVSITNAINNGASKANTILAKYKDEDGNPLVYFDKALKTETNGVQSIKLHFTDAALKTNDSEFLTGVVSSVSSLIVDAVREEAENIQTIVIGAGMKGAVTKEIEIDEETGEVSSDWLDNDSWLYADLYALAQANYVETDGSPFVTVLKIMNKGVDVKITDRGNKSQTYRMLFDIPNFDELIGEGNNT